MPRAVPAHKRADPERPTIVATKRVASGSNFKGGISSYGQVQRDLQRLLHDGHASVITTVLDYYALPKDFPGMRDRPAGSPRSRVEHVETAWAAPFGDRRFVPHLALHEFETWVYADPARLEPFIFNDMPGSSRRSPRSPPITRPLRTSTTAR